MLVPYTERFAIDKSEWNGTYVYNLVIHSVQPSDAGEYICSDDEGYGERYSVQLIVLGEVQCVFLCKNAAGLPVKIKLFAVIFSATKRTPELFH